VLQDVAGRASVDSAVLAALDSQFSADISASSHAQALYSNAMGRPRERWAMRTPMGHDYDSSIDDFGREVMVHGSNSHGHRPQGTCGKGAVGGDCCRLNYPRAHCDCSCFTHVTWHTATVNNVNKVIPSTNVNSSGQPSIKSYADSTADSRHFKLPDGSSLFSEADKRLIQIDLRRPYIDPARFTRNETILRRVYTSMHLRLLVASRKTGDTPVHVDPMRSPLRDLARVALGAGPDYELPSGDEPLVADDVKYADEINDLASDAEFLDALSISNGLMGETSPLLAACTGAGTNAVPLGCSVNGWAAERYIW
jgi:hypothetical protein